MTTTTAWPTSPFTRAHLPALGATESELRRALRDGDLRAMLRGVFLAAEAPNSLELRAAAVATVVAPHHVVTDRAAAFLHGIDVYVYAERDVPPPIETCALRGSQATERPGVEGRVRDLGPEDVMRVHGVLVTTPLRTAMDLGCCLRRREAYAALNEFAREHGITQAVLSEALPRFRRRRGVVQLRGLIPLVEPLCESQRESWVLLAIHDADLPAPKPQHWIEIDCVPTYRLDFAYPHILVCVEYDGADAHDRTPEQRDHDRERRKWLGDHGWTVIVVRRGDFRRAELEQWLSELREALVPGYTNRRWKF